MWTQPRHGGARKAGTVRKRQGEMGSAVQRPVRGTSVSHHERRDLVLLVSSLSARQARPHQASACQAMRRPGSRAAAEPDSSCRVKGSLTSDNARESRRTSRQKVACTTANPASQAETLGEVRSPGRQHGGSSNEYSLHRVLNLRWRFGDQGLGLAFPAPPGAAYVVHTRLGDLDLTRPPSDTATPGPHLSPERSPTPIEARNFARRT